MGIKNHEKAYFYPTKDIINLTKTTTEKIEEKYLANFLKNIITSSDISISQNSKIFFSYFNDINLYEIYFISDLKKNSYIFPFIFSNTHDKNKTELFISEKHFTLFSQGKFKLFKNFTSTSSIKDIEEFIKTRYKISIDNTYTFTNKELNKLKESYLKNLKKTTPNFIKIKDNKSLVYLSGFLISLFTILVVHYNFFYLKNKQKDKENKNLTLLEKKYNSLMEKNDILKSDMLLTIINQIKNFPIKLQSFHLNKNKVYLFLQANKKIDLFNFIDNYNGKIKINKLKFDQNLKKYNLEAMIVLK